MEFAKYNKRAEMSEQLQLLYLGAQADHKSVNKQLELWNK